MEEGGSEEAFGAGFEHALVEGFELGGRNYPSF
jgi:hypothetical protein